MFWGPSIKCDYDEYCPCITKYSTRFSGNLIKLMILCNSWRRFRSHRIKANRQFVYLNGKMQICDFITLVPPESTSESTE